MAQQQYIISLTPENVQIKAFGTEVDKRETEIGALDLMVGIVASHKEDRREFNLCTDLSQQLDNLEGNQPWIVTQGDLDIIRKGFEKLTGRDRPIIWVKLKELFDQIENPVKYPEPDKENPIQTC